jgi:hypothetical protein
LIPLFASICVHSRLENPRKKTRIANQDRGFHRGIYPQISQITPIF